MAELEVPNFLVADKYRLSRLLGRGGMGSVWEGVHVTLGTRVAVKFIESESFANGEVHRRFENEARAAAMLESKHVVEIYDHGIAPNGRPFIVMEFLRGEPLDRRLARVGRFAPVELARVLQQVCRALTKAHAVGIVHRDLKPENIFLVWDEEDAADVVKVVDFGIAKFMQHAPVSVATRTGMMLGTPNYMSPEQARGLRDVDHRSDLWSLGVIAFGALVGRLPFQGEAIGDLLVKICTTRVPRPSELASDLPPAFDAFIARALAPEPSQRFQSAQEFSEALNLACGLTPPEGRSGVPALAAPASKRSSEGLLRSPWGQRDSTNAVLTQTPPIDRAPGSRGRLAVLVGVVLVPLLALALLKLVRRPAPPPERGAEAPLSAARGQAAPSVSELAASVEKQAPVGAVGEAPIEELPKPAVLPASTSEGSTATAVDKSAVPPEVRAQRPPRVGRKEPAPESKPNLLARPPAPAVPAPPAALEPPGKRPIDVGY